MPDFLVPFCRGTELLQIRIMSREFTEEEKTFLKYWEANRSRKHKFFKQVLISLPLGIIIVVAIFLNFFSGWYKRASMVANADPSLFIILFFSGILIVAFLAVFSSYHRWDMNESRYKELRARENNHPPAEKSN